MRTVLTILTLVFFVACRPTKTLTTTQTVTKDSLVTVTNTVWKEVVRDSIIKMPADSSWLEALIECDSNNQARLVEISRLKNGRQVKAPDISLKNNVLRTECNVDSLAVFMTLKEKYQYFDTIKVLTAVRDTTVTHAEVFKPGSCVSGWQWFQIWSGRIFWLLILGFVAWKFLKNKLSFKWVG